MRPKRPARLLVTLTALFALLCAAPAAAQATELRGVQLHSLWPDSSSSDIVRELDLAQRAGSNVVRLDVVWGSLESEGKGRYTQSYVQKLDRFVNGASARGLKVIATLWSSPCWASSAPDSVKQGCSGAWWNRGVGAYPPWNPADYGDAARFVTSRYGAKLAALEVWNEPNLPEASFWKASDKAEAYATLLKAAYPKAKAGNAGVPVLAGGVAFADRAFFQALYAHGIKGYQDGLSFHPYNEARAPADRWKPGWKQYTLVPGIESIRDLQRSQGDEKPLWATEFGWTTGTASGWRVSAVQQAEYTRNSFPELAKVPYLKAAVVYNLREKSNDPTSHDDNFGLVNRDFSPKPAYGALRDALNPGRSRLTLRLRRRGRSIYAVGRAPRRGRVRIAITRCGKGKRSRRVGARVSRRRSYKRRLGRVRSLRGCRVSARMSGTRAASSTRVPRRLLGR